MSKEKTKAQLIKENRTLWEANTGLAGADQKANLRIQDMKKVMDENEENTRKEFTKILLPAYPVNDHDLYHFGIRKEQTARVLSWAEIFAMVGRIQAQQAQLNRYKNFDDIAQKVGVLIHDLEVRNKKHRHDTCD